MLLKDIPTLVWFMRFLGYVIRFVPFFDFFLDSRKQEWNQSLAEKISCDIVKAEY